MRYLKMLGLAAIAALALTAVLGVSSASAHLTYTTSDGTLDPVAIGTELSSSLKSGTSALLKDTSGFSVDTCTSSTVKGKVETNETNTSGGKISSLTFGGCSHTTDVIKPGSLSIDGNGTVTSSGAEVTVVSTIFGISCVAATGAGTDIGTLTDAPSSTGHATMDINGVISMGPCGDAVWSGTYIVTSPTGLHATP